MEIRPEPRDDELRIRVTSCGVCGTDRGCLPGPEPYPTPGVLGHEGAGVVEEVGRNVAGAAAGRSRHHRFSLRRGMPLLSRRPAALLRAPHGAEVRRHAARRIELPETTGRRGDRLGASSSSRPGRHARWRRPASSREVPDHVDADLMGPLACSLSTGVGTVLNELKPGPGSSTAVFGFGAVGLAAIMAARLTGATTLVAIYEDERRLTLASGLGTTHTIRGGAETVTPVQDITKRGADHAVEATKDSNLVAAACASLGMLGTCAMAAGASPKAQVTVNHTDMLQHGKRFVGIMGGGGRTPAFLVALMELQAQGRFPLERLVRFYAFDGIEQASDDSDSGSVVKPILRIA